MLKEAITSKVLSSQNQALIQMQQEEEFIATIGSPNYFCVGIIDIVNSTKTVAKLPSNKASKYYETFLNHMARIVRQYNGCILKTMGDSLLFYFPETRYIKRRFGFLCALECGFAIMSSHFKLKELLEKELLPVIDFRISFDYGNVTMMRTIEGSVDLVGPTINTCSKINGMCPVNGMVVGSDLYEKTRISKEYKFRNLGSFSIDLKHPYPVFTVGRKE